MNNNSGALSFDAYINNTDFKKQIDEMERRIRGLSSSTDQETKRMEAGFSKLGVAIGGALTFAAAQKFIGDLIRVRGEFQQLDIAFRTMLGSKERADALMAQIVQTAATTPFGLQEVAQGAKQLIAYGTAAEEVNGTLIRLGNIAAGLSVPLNDLIYLYGTSATQGRLMSQDLNQFAGRGVPIFSELAKVMGVNKDEIKDLAAEGKIGFEQLQKVVENLTNEGGMFFNLMAAQSKSLTGQISNLGDAWDQMLNEIGQSSEGVLSGGIEAVATLVENYEQVGKVLVALIATYGTYRAALILTTTIQAAQAASTVTLTSAQAAMTVVTGKLRAATALLNTTLLANPYVAVATAVVALAGAMWALSEDSETAKRVQEELNAENEKAVQVKEDLKNKTQELISVIRDENATRFQQAKAFQELQKLYPELYKNVTLEAFAARDAAEAQKELSKARDSRSMQLDAERYAQMTQRVEKLTAELERQERIKEEANKRGFSARNAGLIDAIKQDLTEQRKELERIEAQVKANERAEWEANATVEEKIEHYKQIRTELEAQARQLETTLLLTRNITGAFGSMQSVIDSIRLDGLNNQIAQVNSTLAGLTGAQAGPVRNKAFFEKQKEDAQGRFDAALPNSAEWRQAKADIESANKSLEAWTITRTKAKVKAEEIFPTGSVAEFDRQLRKAEEALSRIPATQTARVKAMQDTILQLTKQRAEAEKLTEIRSWQETLDRKREAYLEYERAVASGIPGLASMQYADLLKGGQTYVDWLRSELLPLQKEGLSGEELKRAVTLQVELNAALGKTAPIDAYGAKLDSTRDSVGSLSEYLAILRGELAAFNGDTSSFGIAATNKVQAEITATEKELKGLLREFLTESNANNFKRLRAESKYNDLVLKARKEMKGKELDIALDAIEQARKVELNNIAEEDVRRSELYRKTHDEVLYFGKEEIKAYIAGVKEKLKHEEMSVELRKAWQRELAMGEEMLARERLSDLNQLAGAINQLMGNMEMEFSKHFKISVQQLTGMVNSFGTAMTGLKKMGSGTKLNTGEKISTGFAIADIVNTVIVGVRDAFLKDKHFETGMESHVKDLERLNAELLTTSSILDRQKELMDDLYGEARFRSAMELYRKFGEQQQKLFERLKKFSIDVIAGQDKVFIDPIFGMDVKDDKGIKTVITQINTLGQAASRTEYEFRQLDTTGFTTIEQFKDLLNEIKFSGGFFNGSEVVASDIEALEALIEAYDKAAEEQKEIMRELREYFTDTNVEAIADALVEGFRQGKRSAADFAGAFEDMMQKALINSFKAKIMDESLGAFYKQFSDLALSDFSLTEDEIASLRELWDKLIEESGKKWDAFEALTGRDIDGIDQDALTGAIKGMSEETASILSGQMNAIRVNQADALGVLRNSLFQLIEIAANTRMLYEIERHLRSMNNGLSYRDLGVA